MLLQNNGLPKSSKSMTTTQENKCCPKCKLTGDMRGERGCDNYNCECHTTQEEKWEVSLKELAKKHIKEHGLIQSENASPKMIWELGFFEAIEIVKPFIASSIAEAVRERDMELREKIHVLLKEVKPLYKWGDFILDSEKAQLGTALGQQKALHDALSLLSTKKDI